MGLSAADIQAAADRIAGYLRPTPVCRSAIIDTIAGTELVFKCEDSQPPGSFKVRGALNAVLSLGRQDAGVITHSSGNHGAALAYAAGMRGFPAVIVMPEGALETKRQAVARFGGQVIECGNSAAERASVTESLRRRSGAEFIHPYNDWRVIAGQASCAIEFLHQVSDLDAIIVPVGGGGLLSGTCLAAAGRGIRVFGAEPEQAGDAARSVECGRIIAYDSPQTIADGLRTPLLEKTWEVIAAHSPTMLTVSEAGILDAMALFARHSGRSVEPSSAVALAAVIRHREQFSDIKTGVILTGGNTPPQLIGY
ncbi:MAG: threonine/serine dehydratase [Rhodobacteraceae bacterium]|nr:threonine/serine dehydratase [Paracoccaceae bacterium]